MSKVDDAPPSLYVVIPARLSSTRLPHKPLAQIGNQPMVAHVCQRAQVLCLKLKQSGLFKNTQVILASDDQQVLNVVTFPEVTAMLTPAHLESGTDRVQWALGLLPQPPKPTDLILNVQGDEPFFSLQDVELLLQHMTNSKVDNVGTLVRSRADWAGFLSPSVVKVVRSDQGHGLYFSRAPIPWPRTALGGGGLEWLETATKKGRENQLEESHLFWHHIGIYAFRYFALGQFALHINKGNMGAKESLEQLRALEAGWKIATVEAQEEPLGVDTQQDLEKARLRWLRDNP